MTRIKIGDLPEEKILSPYELIATAGGGGTLPSGMFEAGQTSMYDPQMRAAGGGMTSWAGYVPPQFDSSKLLR